MDNSLLHEHISCLFALRAFERASFFVLNDMRRMPRSALRLGLTLVPCSCYYCFLYHHFTMAVAATNYLVIFSLLRLLELQLLPLRFGLE